jgi:hypothetical protein
MIFYPMIKSANVFILSTIFGFIINLIIFSKNKNYTLYSLVFIYMKYVMDNIIDNDTIGIHQYEFRTEVMWLFTTPLILKLYCDINNLMLNEINAQYHIGSNILHIILYPFRKTYYNSYIIISLSLSEFFFIYKLFGLHLLTFQTPIFMALKKIKSIKSIVGISPTMVLLFHLPFVYLKM